MLSPMDEVPYPDLLERTAAAAEGGPPPDSEEEAAALARFQSFFEDMTPERVRTEIASVYAEDALLYDTLALHEGLDRIRPYFEATAKRAAGVRVAILDVLRKENDFYARWSMEIDWSAFKKGKPTRSYGMSHLRFNREGRVVLHFDFWDSAQGFFEHLPVIGRLIRAVKRRVAK